ncbi:MAG: single-stranded DNA-binding protein [Bacillota bacterium]|jgi:single-stranded DNA-binding protein|nr:single-stranded DNA-binding protein [Bacillota bacterium]
MNKVFLSGCIASRPSLVNREGTAAHLTFSLDVTHRTSKGETRHELYPVSLWHSAALWGARTLRAGQRVVVNGYLTKRRRYEKGIEVENGTGIAAEEVLVMASRPQDAASVPSSAEPSEDEGFSETEPDNILATQ